MKIVFFNSLNGSGWGSDEMPAGAKLVYPSRIAAAAHYLALAAHAGEQIELEEFSLEDRQAAIDYAAENIYGPSQAELIAACA